MGKKNELWVEKYRPKNVNSIVQQEEIKQLLQKSIEQKNLTHLLFYGPPGTGKTTTALALVKQLFHSKKKESEDIWMYYQRNEKILQDRVMELNASDERGIKVVREKIKNFASSSLNTNYDSELPAFKIIILDEADAMTSDSQFALRRIIEKYTSITRFILICNYVTKIIPPLSSRCAKFRFQSISPPNISNIINQIIINENINISHDTIDILYKITKGDLRKIINLLQRASNLNKNITADTIFNISGNISPIQINYLWNIITNKETSYQDILTLSQKFWNDAYSTTALLNDIFKKIINCNKISDNVKENLLIKISNIDYSINDNANEFIQLIRLFSSIKNIYHNL